MRRNKKNEDEAEEGNEGAIEMNEEDLELELEEDDGEMDVDQDTGTDRTDGKGRKSGKSSKEGRMQAYDKKDQPLSKYEMETAELAAAPVIPRS